ncbi:LysM peptidoglycan-binding domain-containing protein [Chloroflexota bacterium]
MNRRALIVFVILNIAISVGVAMLVIVLWQGTQDNTLGDPVVQVFEVVVTATPGPTQTPWVVTVVGDAPPSAFSTPNPGDPTVAPTLNQDILPDIATAAAATQGAIQVSGSEESTYTVQGGDNPSIIAEGLGVLLNDLLCANDLGTVDDPEFIFEGQVLIVPAADFVCGDTVVEVDDTAEDEEASDTGDETTDAGSDELDSAVEDALAEETPVPTVTLAPTAEDALVVVTEVLGADDVTSEGVFLQNQGGLVDLEGWTLYDTQGNIYTFPDFRLFGGSGVTVFTRVGENTPVALFWGETRAVFQAGDVVSLADASGVVQSTFRVEE